MAPIIKINCRNGFDLHEAEDLLPILLHITKQSSDLTEKKITQLESTPAHLTKQIMVIEKEINDLISNWYSKIRKLGANPKGLYIVDFDCGQESYCWKYPEAKLLRAHHSVASAL